MPLPERKPSDELDAVRSAIQEQSEPSSPEPTLREPHIEGRNKEKHHRRRQSGPRRVRGREREDLEAKLESEGIPWCMPKG